jgi:hypothetical protein
MEVDFLLLADGAQVSGEKLYVMGGGWTVVWSQTFPLAHNAALAVGVMVDWPQTNQRHSIEVALLTGDGQQIGPPLFGGEFEVGRPPGIPAGAAQRFMLAGSVVLNLEAPGLYEIVVRLNGTDVKTASFSAILAAAPG